MTRRKNFLKFIKKKKKLCRVCESDRFLKVYDPFNE